MSDHGSQPQLPKQRKRYIRRTPRHRLLKAARITFAGGAATCTIRSLSSGGGTIECASPGQVPDEFDLVLEMEHRIRSCHVAWRKASWIGVRFQD